MRYEIRQIDIGSVLKISFLISLILLTFCFTVLTSIIVRLSGLLTSFMNSSESLEMLNDVSFNLGTILFSSFFNSILFSIFIIIGLGIIIILYNFFAKYIGGIKIDLSENKIKENIKQQEPKLEE